MNAARLTVFQVRYINKAFWRNPAAAFFTFAFPLMFLVIFTALLGHGTITIHGRAIHQSTYYVAQMGTFGVVSACYTNVAMALVFQRDAGVLKRTSGTPLPAAVYLGAKVLHATLVAVLLIVITVAFGRVAYTADIPSSASLARFVVMLLVGAASFCALGFAVTALVPNFDAAGPVVNAIILPVLFLSGVFIPFGDHSAKWSITTARIFPVKHFADAMQAGIVGTPFNWTDVLVVAAWGLGGALLAIRFFSWEPRI